MPLSTKRIRTDFRDTWVQINQSRGKKGEKAELGRLNQKLRTPWTRKKEIRGGVGRVELFVSISSELPDRVKNQITLRTALLAFQIRPAGGAAVDQPSKRTVPIS